MPQCVVDYGDPAILWVERRRDGRTLHAMFNFSDEARTVWMPERAAYADLVTGEKDSDLESFELAAWDFRWLLR